MNLFLLISILFGLTAAFGVINERFLHLQSTIGLMLLALLTTLVLLALKLSGTLDELHWIEAIVSELDLSDVLLNGVLCFMLFAGSAGVKFELLAEKKWIIIILAIGSTILACLITGALLTTVLGWFGVTLALAYAFVFGALISPTDPIAALAILKSAGLPKPLETIINGESLFNDGVGVVLFTMALAFAGGASQSGLMSGVALFLREVLGGVGLGLLVGFVAHHMLIRTEDYGNQLFITLSTVALGYSVALKVDVSGPISMVVAGLAVGNVTMPRLSEKIRQPLQTFWGGIDEMLNSLLFVMIGFILVNVHTLSWAPLGISISMAILVCLLARAISVYIPLLAMNATPVLDAKVMDMTRLFTWAGLRGGLALALALSLPDSPEKPLLVNMTFGVVVFSILIQGSTIGKLFKPSFLNGILRSG
jgi:CPA1 family monovalent cation:H+ antiporter